MKSRAFCIMVCMSLAVGAPLSAHAAKKKSKAPQGAVKIADAGNLFNVTFQSRPLQCYRQSATKVLPGKAIKNNKFFLLNSYVQKGKERQLQRLIQAASSSGQEKKLKNKLSKLKQEGKGKVAACRNNGDGTSPPPNVAAESLSPLSRSPSYADLHYLVQKAGFGEGNVEQNIIHVGLNQGLDAAVTEFMRNKPEDPALLPRIDNRLDENHTNQSTPGPITFLGIRRALLDWTLNTSNPYRMRMTYFLLHHYLVNGSGFVGAQGGNPSQIQLWWDHFKTLRSAANNPRLIQLLSSLVQQPVMLLAGGNSGNRDGRTTESFARLILDQYLLGPTRIDDSGAEIRNYTEQGLAEDVQTSDVAKVARRLCGWSAIVDDSITPSIWIGIRSDDAHPDGPETLFDWASFNFQANNDVDTIPAIFRNHPAAAQHISRRLLQEFLTPNPPIGLIRKFADLIKQNDFQLEVPMKTLLMSEAFYFAGYQRTLPKNPLEFIVDYTKTMRLEAGVSIFSNTIGTDGISQLQDFLNNTMRWNPVTPPDISGYPRARYAQPTGLIANLRATSRINGTGISLSTGQNPSWLPSSVLLTANGVTEKQLIAHVAQRMGVVLREEQIDELYFYMTLQNGRRQAYQSQLLADQQLKGLSLYMFMGAMPGFVLK